MALAINNNLMANNVTRNLQGHYGKLNSSTQRLSSGLRVSSAADDAAGLAIRELMRADIAALGQGVRNANDGISMIQTADGALGVIDSKLIRMKELAEQSATDTYTDDQRVLINKEYQAMADEINRIARDTDFNSKNLLNGSGISVEKASGSNTLANATETFDGKSTYKVTATATGTATIANEDRFGFTITDTYAANGADQEMVYTQVGDGKVTVASHTFGGNNSAKIEESADLKAFYANAIANNTAIVEFSTDDKNWTVGTIGTAGAAGASMRITVDDGVHKRVDTIKNDSAAGTLEFETNGDVISAAFGTSSAGTLSATTTESTRYNIHFGSSNATTDSYDVEIGRTDADFLGVGANANDHVLDRQAAKQALVNITAAINTKDATRATLGSTQNRLSATIENVSIQKENLQAAESRISDVDVATEMTEFNKQQILANAAVSMLSQANNLPKMAQKLLG